MPRRTLPPGDDLNSDRARLDAIFEEHYTVIKKLMRAALRGESHPTLETTDLVHELYQELLTSRNLSFSDTRQVFNLLSTAARRYLIDRARKRNARRRKAEILVPLSFAEHIGREEPIDILLLNDALEKLARESPLAAEIVQLKWLGLTEKEIAPLVNRKRPTIYRYWEFSKVWLMNALSEGQQGKPGGRP